MVGTNVVGSMVAYASVQGTPPIVAWKRTCPVRYCVAPEPMSGDPMAAGFASSVGDPATSDRPMVKLTLEFDSSCATLATSEVMAALEVSAGPGDALKAVS